MTYNIERVQTNPDLYSITPAAGGEDQSNLYVLASDFEAMRLTLQDIIDKLTERLKQVEAQPEGREDD